MHYAYLDESGTVTPFRASECFLVIAILAASQKASRALELHAKRLRKRAKLPIGEELKASSATPRQRKRLLQAIATEHVAIVAVIIDKRNVYQKPDDPEEWYREAASLAARHCASRWPQLRRLILDKRYTKEALRHRLEETIRAKLQGLARDHMTIEQLDSRVCLGLQVADYVAWAIARKYQAGDQECYELIKTNIVLEEIIEAKKRRASP